MPLHWIALNAVRGLGPVRIKHLLEIFGTPEKIFDQSATALSRQAGISEAIASQIKNQDLLRIAEDQLRLAQKHGVEVITLDNKLYPGLLREIFAPPPVLYAKGRLDCFDSPSIAVVGTRRPSSYGFQAAGQLVTELVRMHITIVSGLALGIDTCAHQKCVDNEAPTIAVLGCGIDRVYPSTNRALADRIVEKGVILSEFSLGTAPEAFNFPRRNRIISGLSSGTLVVEAGQKSGALITADYANQQGRDVYVVPGSIFSERSAGTHALLKNGAIPVRSAQDIVENMTTLSLKNPPAGCALSSKVEELLNESETAIVQELTADGVRLDQLSEATGKSINALMDTLLNLELRGFIRQLPGQLFVRA
ncbi:MAG: DNA-processing protein DprA [Fibrobacterota bacterium]